MSMRVGSDYLGDGSFLVGNSGFGVLAENVPSTGENGPGYLYNDLDLPADNGKEVAGRIVVWPSAGTLAANEDSSFEFTGAPDGAYTFQYQLYVDGVLTGSPATVDLVIGGATTVSATLASIGVSAFDATVITTTNTIVSATAANISVSAFDASVVVGNSTIVNATVASVSVTAYQAVIDFVAPSPNCYTWLTSTITDVEWYSGLIDASPTYFISTINGDPTYVVSTIDGDDLYLIGDLC